MSAEQTAIEWSEPIWNVSQGSTTCAEKGATSIHPTTW